MKFLLLIYIDERMLGNVPQDEADEMMRGCIRHADEMRAEGRLHDSQQLEAPATARTVRRRGDQFAITDGPFAETKEMLAGFNLIEADSLEAAERIAREEFPWSRFGAIEVRPVRDMATVRQRVGM